MTNVAQRAPQLVEVGVHHLQSKRLVIKSRWVSKPLAFAGELRPWRLNKQAFGLTQDESCESRLAVRAGKR
jgi:hypothetical protein